MSRARDGVGSSASGGPAGPRAPVTLASRLLAALPSASAWWSLATTATRPPSSPSTRCSSQSGMSRSSGTLMIRPTSSSSSFIPPGCRQRLVDDVPAHVERPVGHPDGVVEPERHVEHPAAERRQPVQPGEHLLAEPVDVEATGALQDGHLDGVHVHRRRLHVEIAGVDALHALHDVSRARGTGAASPARRGPPACGDGSRRRPRRRRGPRRTRRPGRSARAPGW